MIKSFIKFLQESKQQLNETVYNLNRNGNSIITAQEFIDFLSSHNINRNTTYIKILKFENHVPVKSIDICNQCDGQDGLRLIYNYNAPNVHNETEVHVVSILNDIEAGRQQGFNITNETTFKVYDYRNHETTVPIVYFDNRFDVVWLCIGTNRLQDIEAYFSNECIIDQNITDFTHDSIVLTVNSIMQSVEYSLEYKSQALSVFKIFLNENEISHAQSLIDQHANANDEEVEDVEVVDNQDDNNNNDNADVEDVEVVDEPENIEQNNVDNDNQQVQNAEENAEENIDQTIQTINGLRILGEYSGQPLNNTYNVLMIRHPIDQFKTQFLPTLQQEIIREFNSRPVRLKTFDTANRPRNASIVDRVIMALFKFDNSNQLTWYGTDRSFRHIYQYTLQNTKYNNLFNALYTQSCINWYSSFYSGFKSGAINGVTVLWDPDNHRRQLGFQSVPFTIGVNVQGQGNINTAFANAQQQNLAQQDQQQNNDQQNQGQQQRRQRQPRQNNRRIQERQQLEQLNNSIKANLIASGNSDINAAVNISRDNNKYFSVNFVGVDDTSLLDDQAKAFLNELDMWTGVIEPAFDMARQQYEDIHLIVTLNNKY